MSQKVSRDSPLSEITLRRYEKPYNLDNRELTKKICLSLGLLQPGDGRDVVVDVFLSLLNAREDKVLLSSKDVEERVISLRKEFSVPLVGVASSNIRRQIKRLKDLFLVESVDNGYRIPEFENLNVIFKEKIESFYLKSIISRVKDYLSALDKNE